MSTPGELFTAQSNLAQFKYAIEEKDRLISFFMGNLDTIFVMDKTGSFILVQFSSISNKSIYDISISSSGATLYWPSIYLAVLASKDSGYYDGYTIEIHASNMWSLEKVPYDELPCYLGGSFTSSYLAELIRSKSNVPNLT